MRHSASDVVRSLPQELSGCIDGSLTTLTAGRDKAVEGWSTNTVPAAKLRMESAAATAAEKSTDRISAAAATAATTHTHREAATLAKAGIAEGERLTLPRAHLSGHKSHHDLQKHLHHLEHWIVAHHRLIGKAHLGPVHTVIRLRPEIYVDTGHRKKSHFPS